MDQQDSSGCRRCSNGHNVCSLSGQASDAGEGRELLGGIGPLPAPLYLILDQAYEDNTTLQLALDCGYLPVIPPRHNRLRPWQYDKALYRKRDEIDGFSADSKASVASSPASTNSMSFSSLSSTPL